MKVIFLDVDGVLNKSSDYEVRMDGGYFRVNLRLVDRLKSVIAATGAQLVLSSSWRNARGGKEFLEEQGLVFHGVTEYLNTLRGAEIKAYLDKYATDKYVILDDDSDMFDEQLPNFFQTDPEHGLTATIAYRVAYHLGGDTSKIKGLY